MCSEKSIGSTKCIIRSISDRGMSLKIPCICNAWCGKSEIEECRLSRHSVLNIRMLYKQRVISERDYATSWRITATILSTGIYLALINQARDTLRMYAVRLIAHWIRRIIYSGYNEFIITFVASPLIQRRDVRLRACAGFYLTQMIPNCFSDQRGSSISVYKMYSPREILLLADRHRRNLIHSSEKKHNRMHSTIHEACR